MIVVSFFKSANGRRFFGFSVLGHANFGKCGKDILCAAISSAVYLVVNTATEVIGVKPLILEVLDGKLSFKLNSEGAVTCYFLLKGLELHLSEIARQYPKNIIVKYINVKE